MRLIDLQNAIKAVLDGNEALMQGGCKAIVEDSLTVAQDVQTQLQLSKGVALVVTTPRATFSGDEADGGISVDCRVAVRCMEIRAASEKQTRITSLEAAQEIALALNGPEYSFVNIEEQIDRQTGVLVNTANFDTTIILT